MPRPVSCVETELAQLHEQFQRERKNFSTAGHFETGLVLAHVGTKADTILGWVRTPALEAKHKAKSIDVEWMVQHAKQVSTMLPGGIVRSWINPAMIAVSIVS